jgi:sporulation protein YlmC with PRC-barrel domain
MHMATNLAGIQTGMDVYDSTGEKIGSIDDVLTLAAYSQNAQNDPLAGTTTDTGYGTGETDENSILKVSEGGVLGIGATELYVPMDAIANITPGESVTLNCSKAQCENMYAQKPSFLDNA